MKTHNTYPEAKIANPDCDIWVDSTGVFHIPDPNGLVHHDAEKCTPADYCSTVEEFLDAGYKLEVGDVVLHVTSGVVSMTEAHLIHWNFIKPVRPLSYILQSSALNGGSKIPEPGMQVSKEELDAMNDAPGWRLDVPLQVGVECELKFKGGNTFNVRITYIGDGVFAYLHIDGKEAGKEYVCGSFDVVEFRPLKTPEQVEVEKLAYELFLVWDNNSEIAKSLSEDGHPGVSSFEEFQSHVDAGRCSWIEVAKAAIKHIKGG